MKAAAVPLLLLPVLAYADASADQAAIAALDTEYQSAVKNNDTATMARLLADDFVLISSKGKVFTKANLLAAATNKDAAYEHQEDTRQTVRVWGDTGVVTALLWLKGTAKDGGPFDYKLWFSDTYVRTPDGWRYVLGQAGARLPESP